MSHPYREPAASTRVDEPARRWGATTLARVYVRLFRSLLRSKREEAREWAAYYRRMNRYEENIREWRGKQRDLEPQERRRQLKYMPIMPTCPPRRVLE